MTLSDSAEGIEPAPPAAVESRSQEKVRIRFRKVGSLRFIGHHDLMRTWERLLRRAEIPLRSSQGFNPRPVISSPLSLALGLEADEELIEFELVEELAAGEVARRLAERPIDGLSIVSVEKLPSRQKTRVIGVELRCRLPDGADPAPVAAAARAALAADSLKVVRRLPDKPPREVDLRPWLESIEVQGQEVRFHCRVDNGATVRHDELLDLLSLRGYAAEGMTVRRSRLLLEPSAS
jgi:radical SAM-linked protein